MNIVEQLMHTTVRIECSTAAGERTSGTGFFCHFCERGSRRIPAIVTNMHVVRDAVAGVFRMTVADDEGQPRFGEQVEVPIKNFGTTCIPHPNENIDLAAFPLAPVLHAMDKQGKVGFFRALTRDLWADADFMNELNPVEEILMVGYPNGLWDSKNNLPIARRGITATAPYIDFEGRPEFMIDCACFPGSSGSPVFLLNMGMYTQKSGGVTVGGRMKLLGVLWGGPQYTAEGEIVAVPVPTAVQPIARSRIPNNLGYCVKASELLEFEKHFEKSLPPEQKSEDAQAPSAA